MEHKGLTNIRKAVFFIITYAYISSTNSLVRYRDLEILDATCYPKDTCLRNFRLAFKNRSCECDQACHRFNDCCVDAPRHRRRNLIRNENLRLNCYEYDEEKGLGTYAVTDCPSDYHGPEEIRQHCEGPIDMSNPLENVPVTDTSTNITYKNHFCAQCNNVFSNSLQSWNVKVQCPNLTEDTSTSIDFDFIADNLVFLSEDYDDDTWGFYYPPNEIGQGQFYSCQTSFKAPESLALELRIRLCRPRVISTCASNRQIERRKCASYMAVVLVGHNFYRNPHCALCNNETELSNLQCMTPSTSIFSRGNKKSLPMSILLDYNTADGDLVNQKKDTRCPNNHRFDIFSKSCRSTFCLPGRVLRGGKCVLA